MLFPCSSHGWDPLTTRVHVRREARGPLTCAQSHSRLIVVFCSLPRRADHAETPRSLTTLSSSRCAPHPQQNDDRAGYYTTRYGVAPGSVPDEALGARDPRINLLQRSWFEGKKCLDVGCNEGHLTLAIVRRFRPRRMVGVDIDGYLVQLARKVGQFRGFT